MAAIALADTGFLVAFLSQRDAYRDWALALAGSYPRPWRTCEAVLTEAFYLVGPQGSVGLEALLRRGALVVSFHLADEQEPVLRLMHKYAEVPMSFADACLVRMTEMIAQPMVLTTDSDFRIYRRHSRQTIPCVLPA